MIARALRMNNASKSNMLKLVNYLTSSQGNAQRVQSVRISNCEEKEDAEWAALEMLATQKMNTRAQGDKTYHLVLSFHENLSERQLAEIEERVCSKLGFVAHQRISVLHGDTDNPHLHIAINKIHPRQLTIHEPFYDQAKLADISKVLEQRYSLVPDNHVFRSEARETAAKSMEIAGDMESLIGWIQRNALDDMKNATSWEELHTTLATNGLSIKQAGNGLIIASGKLHVKASSVDRKMSRKNLEARLGAFVPGKVQNVKAERSYSKRPMPLSRRDTKELWNRYTAWRAQQDRLRKEQLVELQQRRETELSSFDSDLKRAITKHVVKGQILKRILYAMQHSEAKRKRQAILAKYTRERHKIFQEKPNLSWRTWLENEAKAGNADALKAIRARQRGEEWKAKFSGRGVLMPNGSAKQKPQLKDAVKITLKGTLLFKDGCRDDGRGVSIPQHSDETIITCALERIVKQHGRVPISLDMTPEQARKVVEVAAAQRIPVSFNDPALERMRQQSLAPIIQSREYSR
nr:TraI/MobA(P) family conjugative relaxase [uncultured Akkermansia sp.]